LQFLVNSNLNCSSSNGHELTFLNTTNNNNNAANHNGASNGNTTTTVLPDFQYLTSPSGEQPTLTATTNHIPTCPIPKSVDCNQYGNNITNNNNHHHHQQQQQHHHSNGTHVS
jgi:hypothetical protein